MNEKFDANLLNKQRYYEIVYAKNREYLDKFQIRRIKIEKDKILEEKQRNREIDREREKQKELEIEKEKEKIKERDLKQKMRQMEENARGGRIQFMKESIMEPEYATIKDSFEILLEKNQRRQNMNIEFKPRFQEIEKEKIQKPYNDKDIWKRWEKNREIMKEKGRLKTFLERCRKKEFEHSDNMKKIEEQSKEIQKIRRELMIKRGYGDPSEIKTINYSLVEESSPKYTIKGRNIPKTKSDNEDIGNLLIGRNLEMMEYIKKTQMSRPLPNINFVKPCYPNIVFSKAERFIESNKPYEGPSDLFKDGVFAPKTQEDFRSKGTFPQSEKTGLVYQSTNYPSPCDYKIKSLYDLSEKNMPKKIAKSLYEIKYLDKKILSSDGKYYLSFQKTKNQ